MSCILRVSGKKFNVDKYLTRSKLKPCAVYRKGEPRFTTKPKGRKNKFSGINIEVSNADFNEFDRSVNDAIRWLKKNGNEIKKLLKSGIDGQPDLDFGISTRPVAVQCERFPPELLKLAGKLGLAIVSSRYPKGW